MMMTNRTLICILSIIACNKIYSQQAFLTTGNDINSTGGTLSYSIGQTLYLQQNGTSFYNIQGVQQPYEISITNIHKNDYENSIIRAYPNPVSKYIILEFENTSFEDLIYQLTDITGKIIMEENIKKSSSIIDLENLSPSIYFIKIANNSNTIKTFKFIKI